MLKNIAAKIKIRQSLVIYIVLAGFFVFNLATLSKYGMTWDEAAQHHIGRVALDYILGRTTGMEFLRPDLVYYGPFFEILNQGFGELLLKAGLGYVDAFHVLILLTGFLGILFFFWLIRRLFGEKIAFWASLFLFFLPGFAAHMHYNSKDIPLAAGFVIILYFLTTGFFDRKIWKIIAAGIAFGLCLDIRMDALLVMPVFFGAYLSFKLVMAGKAWRQWKYWRTDFIYLAAFVLLAAIAAFVTWPSLWHNPALFFQALQYFTHHGWPGYVLYMGKYFLPSQLPWHYQPMYLFMTTPAVLLILFSFGVFIGIKKIILQFSRKEKISGLSFFGLLLLFFWIAIRLILTVLPNAVRYDGVRHLLIVMSALAAVAALGLNLILEKAAISYGKYSRLVAAGILIVIFSWLAVEFKAVFPFGDSYFNEFTRIFIGRHLENRFEVEYWGASYRQGVEWLNKNAQQNANVCVPVADHLLQFYPKRADLTFSCGQRASYLMFITRYAYLPDNLDQIFQYSRLQTVYKISRLGSDLLYIYQLP